MRILQLKCIVCELTHNTNTHEQLPYWVCNLNQISSAERRIRQETRWLAGGPLLRVATIRRATDTHCRHTLQKHTADTHYRNTLQTHITDTTLQTHTTDTLLFISHTTNVLLFKFRCNVFIGVRIIREMPGSVASGTPCITLGMFRIVFFQPLDSSQNARWNTVSRLYRNPDDEKLFVRNILRII